jgi:hypothetical protein
MGERLLVTLFVAGIVVLVFLLLMVRVMEAVHTVVRGLAG